MLRSFILIFCTLFLLTESTYAALSRDCTDYMMPGATSYSGTFIPGASSSLVFSASDSSGVAQVCRNQYKAWQDRIIFTRTTADWTTAQYTVKSTWCWVRNGLFDNWSCNWFGSSVWAGNYSYTFSDSDIKSASDSSGRQILVDGSGNPGYNVCLKRYAPGEALNQGGTNTKKRPIVCAYVVNAVGPNSCQSPYATWEGATIGCVDDVIKSRPPTLNPTMPATVSPYVDSTIGLLDSVDDKGNKIQGYISLGSKFDQPVVRLIRSNTSDSLLLRYKFAGDTSIKPGDTLKQCDIFPKTSDGLQYCAMVPNDQPDVVCACEKSNGCPNNIWMGCVPRPTPSQSGLAIVAEYNPYIDTTTNKLTPALNIAFALADTGGNIIYYDQDGSQVYFDASNNPFKMSSSGTATTNPATLPLKFNRLPLPNPPVSIREQYVKSINAGSSTVYINMKDSATVYGVNFQTIIPKLDSNKNPTYVGLQTKYTRATTDGCGAIDFGLPSSTNLQQFYVPDGSRNRTNCICPANLGNSSVCPIPPNTPCADGKTVPDNPNALLIYCPGLLAGYPGGNGINICLQPNTPWTGGGLTTSHDKLCIPIPLDCNATDQPYKEVGYVTWPKLTPGTSINGTCDAGYGLAQRITLGYSPAAAVPFDANFKYPANYNGLTNPYDIYNLYLQQFSASVASLAQIQSDNDLAGTAIAPVTMFQVIFGFAMANFYAPNPIGMNHTINSQFLVPARTCPAANSSASASVTNACVFTNGCPAITKSGFITGNATWPQIRALNTSEQATLASNPNATFNITMEGTCSSTTTQVGANTPPTRVCSLQYKYGQPYIFKWQDVQNPCLAPQN